jgi:KDO2-lipid IV(A) lauroyltransferase
MAALERCSQNQFERWVAINGWTSVRRAYDDSRGVILLISHFALDQLIGIVLDRIGVEYTFIGGWYGAVGSHPYPLEQLGLRHLKSTAGYSRTALRQSWQKGQLYQGWQILQQGGVIVIGADGYQGQGGLTTPFHGRMRSFKTGFAELALSTGATVIPFWVSMENSDGYLLFIFLEALDPGTSEMNHQERVESLVKQYVALLHEIWAMDLGSISWQHLERFLALPSSSPSPFAEHS